MPFSLHLHAPGADAADAAGDFIASHPTHWRRENYIPVRKAELVELLAGLPDLPAADARDFRQFSKLLAATFHYEFLARLEDLKNSYAPFDPDADTESHAMLSPPERDRRAAHLFEKLIWLLEKANFVRLTHDDLAAAIGARSDWGVQLKVDLQIFDRLEVFARGDVVGSRTLRRWRNLWRLERADVPLYQRLVLVFRLRSYQRVDGHIDDETVHLKIFKNIPKLDLEMLLPGTRVKMTLADQSRILLPTVSGVAITGWKLFEGALVVAAAGIYGTLTFLGLVTGTLGYAAKSVFGYLRTQQKYQLNLTRNLYYQNLDNNAGVLFRLIDEAEEQECREVLLGYFFLWRRAGTEGWEPERLDREIESFLREQTGVDVDFEIPDAVDKLLRLGLVERAACGRLRAVPIARALELLDEAWDNLFCYHTLDNAAASAEMPRSRAA